jgi:NlpC/P60 family
MRKSVSLHIGQLKVNFEFWEALTAASLNSTIEGASTLKLTFRDPEQSLLTSGLLQYTIDALVGDVRWYSLVNVQKAGGDVTLTFEDRAVAWMRKYNKPRRVYRDKYTRAQFVRMLVREVREGKIDFYSPALKKVQQVAARTNSTKTPKSERHGIPNDARITVKGVTATPFQRRVANDALFQAELDGASKSVMIGVVLALTQESVMGLRLGKTGNDDISYLQQGREWIGVSQSKDVRKCVSALLIGHRAKVGGTGKVTDWLSVHGSLSVVPDGYEAALKKVQGSVGGYMQEGRLAEARKTVEAYLGSPTARPSQKTAKSKSERYAFARGQGGKTENTWSATGRLADEVGWRRYMTYTPGNPNGLFVFASEQDLFRKQPVVTLKRGLRGFVDLDFEVDTGHAVSEVKATVSADTMTIHPGDIAMVEGYGPADARWLITEIDEDLMQEDGDTVITLKQPILQLKEPASRDATAAGAAATVVTFRSGDFLGGTARDRVVAAAYRALANKSHYLYGQVRPYPSTLFPAKYTKSIVTDCSGFAILCFKAAGASDPNRTNYNGSGNTDSLEPKGKRTSSPRPGDLCFWTGHVAVYVGEGKCISFGNNPIKLLPVTYRPGVRYVSYLP